jgi:transcription elongation factor Elf1
MRKVAGTIKKFVCPACGTEHDVDVHHLQKTVLQICQKCRSLKEMTRKESE